MGIYGWIRDREAHTSIDSRVGAGNHVERHAGGLEGLVDNLEQQPLLWVDGHSLLRRDVEEPGIKHGWILGQKVAVRGAGGSIVDAGRRRRFVPQVGAADEVLPELGGARRAGRADGGREDCNVPLAVHLRGVMGDD